ncbi:zinc metalloproteinase nas-26-like [Liolophura sinensis]|uniref:zinc metalloproteinase nas-26-like n=1 Tax=Liolophura sinensis TaxID=3198878 RepID=UPI0031594A5C
MLFTAVLALVVSSSFSYVLKDRSSEFRANPSDFRAARHVVERTWDFSTCAPGSRLKLGGKVLNKRNLALTTLDAVKLAPLLHQETFEDRMDVWCKLAKMEVKAARGLGKNHVDFDVEELDKFQGDIVVDKEFVDILLGAYDEQSGENGDREGRARLKRATTIYEQFYWDSEIRWQFSPVGLDSSLKNDIRQGFNFIQDNTCVRFREFPASPNLIGAHVTVKNSTRCGAVVGKRGERSHDLLISESCSGIGTVLHEIGHVLGLFHEHTRPDRDLYLNINTENVWDGATYLHLINDSGTFTYSKTLGIPYDYASVMHYSAYAFSKNSLPTISPKDPIMEQVLGQRETMSFFDVKFINTMYACAGKCGVNSLEWNFCKNGGYRDPNDCDRCKCPSGFAPPSCAEISPGINANCGQRELVATEVEKTLTSPGYPSGYPGRADCAWIIRAPRDQRLRLQFKGEFHVEPHSLTCRAFVEVRYKDVTLAGAREVWRMYARRSSD